MSYTPVVHLLAARRAYHCYCVNAFAIWPKKDLISKSNLSFRSFKVGKLFFFKFQRKPFAMTFSVDRQNQSKMPYARTEWEKWRHPVGTWEKNQKGKMAEVILQTYIIFHLAAFDCEQKGEENALRLLRKKFLYTISDFLNFFL